MSVQVLVRNANRNIGSCQVSERSVISCWGVSLNAVTAVVAGVEGAYGFTEAPHLWYLSSHGQLTGPVTMTEFRCARAVFTKHGEDGLLLGK